MRDRGRPPRPAGLLDSVPMEHSRSTGIVIAAAAAVALGCLSIDLTHRLVDPGALMPPDVQAPSGMFGTIYSVDHVALAVVLGVAGLGLGAARTPVLRATLAGVAGLCAAQLAGLGAVALRRWPAVVGAWGGGTGDFALVKTLAVVLAAAGVVAAVASLTVVLRLRQPEPRALAVSVPLGLGVAVALPLMVPGDHADLPDRIAVALQYGLPLGVGLALTGILATVPSLAVSAAIIASSALMPVSWAFVRDASPAVLVVVAAASVTVAWRLGQAAAAERRAAAPVATR